MQRLKLNDKKVELILTKGLKKDLIDKYIILNSGKYFGKNGL